MAATAAAGAPGSAVTVVATAVTAVVTATERSQHHLMAGASPECWGKAPASAK